MKLNIIASVVLFALAIFLCVVEYLNTKHIINVRGLFVLGFIGGFAISLLKLSKLSSDYSMLTIMAVFVSYFSLYLGVYFASKKPKENQIVYKKFKIENVDRLLSNQDILLIILIAVTFLSFIVEAIILGFVPAFTKDTPHAYSTFHIFGLHYITTLYVFIPSIALCNYLLCENDKIAKRLIIVSFVYVIALALLMVSRSQLIMSFVISFFVFLLCKFNDIPKYLKHKRNLVIIIVAIILFLVLYVVITISRAHNIEYLNGIFEMKNEKTPIIFTQPYMYIAHNFENLNYMINNTFRWTFGRRTLYPLFTLLLIKKFFPIVVDSPYYVIKEELSTVSLIYDFYYDFGLVGVIIFCFIIGYIGKKIEDKAYKCLSAESSTRNNYILILLSLYCYIMLFSFFQAFFSLTDIWVCFIFIGILTILFTMTKKYPQKIVKELPIKKQFEKIASLGDNKNKHVLNADKIIESDNKIIDEKKNEEEVEIVDIMEDENIKK